MIKSLPLRLLCVLLVLLIDAPRDFAQAPPSAPAQPVTAPPQPPSQAGGPLTIAILRGDKAVNSLSLLHAQAPFVEVRDSNDLPVEGATVVFTLPGSGPGGTFVGNGVSFTTRTDARGQATTPAIAPRIAGKFEIHVSATLGSRAGEADNTQTNSMLTRAATDKGQHHWYRNKWVWIGAGGAAAAVVTVILVKGGSSGNAIAITPGAPVFQ